MRKKENLFTIVQMYQVFKETYNCDVSLKQYHDILKEFNIWLREWTFESNIFTMPYRLGKLLVYQSNPTFEFSDEGKLLKTTARIDWQRTAALWKKTPKYKEKETRKFIYYENSHTNGKKMKISWESGKVHKIKLCYFKPCRTYQRDLAHFIFKNPNTQYYGW